jgi:hypothetical protein
MVPFLNKLVLLGIFKKFNSVLIFSLEEKKEIEVYAAIKETIQCAALQKFGESREKSGKKMHGRSLARFVNDIKIGSKKDPKSTFFFLVEVHSRLLTKEDFEKFFRELLSELSSDSLDKMIFKNPDLNLQFKDA